MSYLNLDENYFDHIKTKRLVARLGFGAELLPLQLWCHAAHYFPENGIFKGYTAEEIKSFCKWNADANTMLLALLDLGFLIKTAEHSYQINDWEDHQGHIISFKIRGKNNAEKRWAKYRSDKENASSITSSNAKVKSGNAPTKPTIPTIPNQTNSSIFTPPTIEEVTTYCKDRSTNVDPNKWHNFYTAKNWMIGKNKMKDWKAAVRTWETKETSVERWNKL